MIDKGVGLRVWGHRLAARALLILAYLMLPLPLAAQDPAAEPDFPIITLPDLVIVDGRAALDPGAIDHDVYTIGRGHQG